MGKQVSCRAKPRFEFCVFIAHHTSRSDLALERLKKICDENVPDDYHIEVVDIAKGLDLARGHQIVAAPAMFRTLPAPLRKFIGD
jgi:circadian clock protein KaiB